MRRVSTKWLGTGLVFVLAVFLIIVLHQLVVLGSVFLLRGITSAEIARPVVRLFLSSPVYAELMLKTLGGINPLDISVSGAAGHLLHQTFPNIFLDPQYVAPGALVSAVIDPNSTVLSILATQGIAEAFLIALGALLVRAGWHRRHALGLWSFLPGWGWIPVALGLYTEAQAIRALASLTLAPTAPSMRDTGIGFGLSRVLGLDPDSYHSVMDQWLPIAIPVVLIILGFIAAWLGYKVFNRVRYTFSSPQRRDTTAMPFAYHASALALLTVLTVFSPWSYGYFNLARMNAADVHKLQARNDPSVETRVIPGTPEEQSAPTEAVQPTQATQALEVTPTQTLAPTLAPIALATLIPTPDSTPVPSATLTPTPTVTPTPSRPARVEIRRGANGLELHVNGQRTIVTGVNYNVNYTGLPESTKRSLHRRDMKLMYDAGVNAIIGWGVYDEVTLQVASEFQIGVFMPYDLDAQAPYENQGYRERVKSEFGEFVRRYRSFPAVWGWNPGGDELLHRMDTEQRRTSDKLQAAASLLVEMSTLAYSLDSERISIVKEPRDWYIPFFDVALKKERARSLQSDPARYFVFGLNVYGHPKDVSDAVVLAKRNAEERLQVAMIVGEYAPFGLPRKDRATHYAMIWDQMLMDTPNGGFAYVFGPDQPNPQSPNPYDPLRLLVNEFSLLDINGVPVDDSFSSLSARWRRVQNATSPSSILY